MNQIPGRTCALDKSHRPETANVFLELESLSNSLEEAHTAPMLEWPVTGCGVS